MYNNVTVVDNIVYLKFTRTVDLKCFHHTQKSNVVRWWIYKLTRLWESFHNLQHILSHHVICHKKHIKEPKYNVLNKVFAFWEIKIYLRKKDWYLCMHIDTNMHTHPLTPQTIACVHGNSNGNMSRLLLYYQIIEV